MLETSTAAEASQAPPLKLNDAEPSAVPPKAEAIDPGYKRLIRLRDLFAMLDVSKPTGHRLLAAGKIGPRPIRLTSACVRFDVDEVNIWLSARRPDGTLHDTKTWPSAWDTIKRRKGI
jgi:predicted DNA-binding transcriptional regulator AlpA